MMPHASPTAQSVLRVQHLLLPRSVLMLATCPCTEAACTLLSRRRHHTDIVYRLASSNTDGCQGRVGSRFAFAFRFCQYTSRARLLCIV